MVTAACLVSRQVTTPRNKLPKYYNKCNSERYHGGHPIKHANETVSRSDPRGES
jgi:hypothetical protein